MPINPLTGLEEQDELTKLFAQNDADRQKLVDEQRSYDTTGAISGALASLGAAFQGKDSMAAVNQIQNQRRQSRQDEMSALDKWKAAKIQEIQAKRQGVMNQREDEKYAQDQELQAREKDINSQESKMANELASAMGYKGAPITAAQFKSFSPVMQKKYEVEQKKISDQNARDERRFLLGMKQNEDQRVRDEKKQASINEVEDRRTNIEDNLALLEKMITEDGTYELFGSHNADLDRRVEAIATDMAKLSDPSSVARPSEVEAFKKGLVSAGATDMSNATALSILKNFRDEVNKRAANAYSIRGLQDPGSKKASVPPGEVPMTPVSDPYESMSDEDLINTFNSRMKGSKSANAR